MRIFHITPHQVLESAELPQQMPEQGFVWMAFARREFEVLQHDVQQSLERLCGTQLVDLHVQDVLNNQLPSHYDYTSDYNLMVFRRLAAGQSESDLSRPGEILHRSRDKGGPPVLHRIDTSPVAFVVFDRLVLTVHPTDCAVRDSFAARLLSSANGVTHATIQRMPVSPPDLMLRVISQMVDGYLNLRRELTRQLDHWQTELINPHARFKNWSALLDARLSLHHLDEICEDQRAAELRQTRIGGIRRLQRRPCFGHRQHEIPASGRFRPIGGIDPRRAVQPVDGDAGVIGQRGQARGLRREMRLDPGIADESGLGLCRFGQAKLTSRGDSHRKRL